MGIDFGIVHDAAHGVFGQDVIYTPLATGTPMTISAIYRKAHRQIDLESGAAVLSDQPTADVRLSELFPGTPQRGDKLEVGGIQYDVSKIERDGEGGATLLLMKK